MICSFTGKYRFLSNFFIEPDGTCVECEYQAAKSADPMMSDKILNCGSPGRAKLMGGQVRVRDNWKEVRLTVMEHYVRCKFHTHTSLKLMLLATGEEELVEGNHWGDVFYGRVYNHKTKEWEGLNHLGAILMKVRDELRFAML